jgi:serine phosphatase RsbU (regulator of sigma subunit)
MKELRRAVGSIVQMISSRPILPINIICLASLTLLCLVISFQTRRAFNQMLNDKIDTALAMIETTCRDALVNYDLTELGKTARVNLTDIDINRVQFLDHQNKLMTEAAEERIGGGVEERSRAIYTIGKKIAGTVKIMYSRDRSDRLILMVIFSSALCAVMVQIAVYVISRKVLSVEKEKAGIEAERQLLEKDIVLAAAVQTLFLPKKNIFAVGNLTLQGFYQPASTASGDWWWYKSVEEDRSLVLFMGDVSGHGAASAMLTASTSGNLQTLAKMQVEAPVEKILTTLNEEFLEVSSGSHTMTMGALRIGFDTGVVKFCNAAGPPIYILNKEGKVRMVGAQGTPLGTAEFSFETKELKLQDGDRVCFLTDGITEMVLPDQSQLRPKRFVDILTRCRPLSQPDAVNFIVDELARIRSTTPLADDMTFVIVDFVIA